MKRSILAILLVAACKSATPPAPRPAEVKPVPAEALEDREGDSVETAVMVPADAPDGGADFENQWIFDRYGRFQRYASGTGTANGRRYNVVKIQLPGGEKKAVYFDITENWAREIGGQASPPVPRR